MRQKTATLQHPMAAERHAKPEKEQVQETSNTELDETLETEGDEPEETISPQEYGDLRNLIFLGRLEEDVELGGFRFKVSTLNNSQQRKIVAKLMQYDQIKRQTDVKIAGLAEAIVSVNGVTLEKLYNGPEVDDILEKKIIVLENLQANVITKLANAYDKLSERAIKGLDISLDEIKK